MVSEAMTKHSFPSRKNKDPQITSLRWVNGKPLPECVTQDVKNLPRGSHLAIRHRPRPSLNFFLKIRQSWHVQKEGSRAVLLHVVTCQWLGRMNYRLGTWQWSSHRGRAWTYLWESFPLSQGSRMSTTPSEAPLWWGGRVLLNYVTLI